MVLKNTEEDGVLICSPVKINTLVRPLGWTCGWEGRKSEQAAAVPSWQSSRFLYLSELSPASALWLHGDQKRNKVHSATLLKYPTLSYLKCFLMCGFPPIALGPFRTQQRVKVAEGRIRVSWVNNKGMDLIYSQTKCNDRKVRV